MLFEFSVLPYVQTNVCSREGVFLLVKKHFAYVLIYACTVSEWTEEPFFLILWLIVKESEHEQKSLSHWGSPDQSGRSPKMQIEVTAVLEQDLTSLLVVERCDTFCH